jgi:hypothetical protein
MCKQNNEIKFCTCIGENIDIAKDKYIWTLNKFLGSKGIKGKILKPIEDFGNGITIEIVLDKINNENIFDFEYIPEEKDCLTINIKGETRSEYKYFSLLFENGKWRKGGKAFSNWGNIAKGEVKKV